MADPVPINEVLLDRTIRHAVLLHNLSNHEVEQIVGGLNDELIPALEAEIASRLIRIRERGFDIGAATTARFESMLKAVQKIAADGTALLKERLDADLQDQALAEAQFTAGLIGNVLPAGFDTTVPSENTLRTAYAPGAGSFRAMLGDSALLADWDVQLADDLSTRIEQTLRTGIVSGQTNEEIIAALRGTRDSNYTDGVWETTRVSAERLVRTATNHVATVARDLTYQDNADLIDSIMWVSTLDSTTCEECGALDGETFALDEGDRPPIHFNCRCTTVPVVKSWQDLGIDAAEIDDGTRASMDGQVPDSVTYDEWLRDQPQSVIDEALGPTRGALFTDGKLDIKSFVGTNGTLTLDALAKREADAFARAGVAK